MYRYSGQRLREGRFYGNTGIIWCGVGLRDAQSLAKGSSFVGLSFLSPRREDIVEEAALGVEFGPQGVDGTTELGPSAAETDSGGATDDVQVQEDLDPDYDRRGAFSIDDEPGLGPEASFATKNLGVSGPRIEQRKLMAIAVREHRTDKFAKVLRLMYTVLSSTYNTLNTWKAVPKAAAVRRRCCL